MPYPRARKTPQRRTSALQRKVLDFVQRHPKASFGDIRDALGIAPRRSSKLYDSLRVLMERGLIKRQRKIIVITGGFEYRLPTVPEQLAHTWKAAYAEYPGQFKDLFQNQPVVEVEVDERIETVGLSHGLTGASIDQVFVDEIVAAEALSSTDSPAPTLPQE